MNFIHQRYTPEAVQRIQSALNFARGAALAVTIDRLAEAAELPDRRTAEIILEECWDKFPFVLVSGATGIYQPTQPEELNHFIASQRSRAVKCFLKARKSRRKALAAGWQMDGKRFVQPARQLDLFGETRNVER